MAVAVSVVSHAIQGRIDYGTELVSECDDRIAYFIVQQWLITQTGRKVCHYRQRSVAYSRFPGEDSFGKVGHANYIASPGRIEADLGG